MNKNIDIEYESMKETIDEGNELIAEYKQENRKLNDKIIDLNADLGMYQNENEHLTKDIEKYWQLEQELGCPLEVVFKAMEEGIVIKTGNLRVDGIYPKPSLSYCKDGMLIGFALLKDYQKTWWLKGEKDGNCN